MKRETLFAALRDRALKRSDSQRITRKLPDGNAIELSWLFDFRAVMLDPQWLNTYAELFWERFESQLPFQVGGMETAGIPLVAAIVMKGVERGTPVNGLYVRKSRKREGLMKAIEGTLTSEPVILVDDLMNSGSSLEKQIKVLQAVGATVLSTYTILAFRKPEAYAHLTRLNINVQSEFTLDAFGIPTLPSEEAPPELHVRWAFAAGNPSFEHVLHKSSPAIDRTRVYIGSDRGRFFALSLQDGSNVWSFDIAAHPPGKGIFSSPLIHRSVVYFGAYDGAVYALNTANGTELWKNTDADWIGSSPDIASDLGLLFIGLEFGLFRKRGGIAALSLKTGELLWRNITPALTHGSPLYIKEKGMVVIGSNDGIVYAYDARSGRLLWHAQTPGDIKMRPAYDPHTDTIVVAPYNGGLYAYASSGAVRWHAPLGPLYATPLIHEGVVYIGSLDKYVYAIECATGALIHKRATNGRIFSSATYGSGALWIGSNDGRLYKLEPRTLKILAYFQAPERFVGKPVVDASRNSVMAITVANELLCFDTAS